MKFSIVLLHANLGNYSYAVVLCIKTDTCGLFFGNIWGANLVPIQTMQTIDLDSRILIQGLEMKVGSIST